MEQLLGILAKVVFFAFIVGMFTLVIWVFVRSNKEDKRIRRAWAELPQVAVARGWTYEQRARGQATQYCGVGPMPGSGSNLSAWHYITGEFRGHSFKCFEHRYNSPMSGNAGERKRPTIEAIFMIALPGSGQPVEILRPGKTDVLLDRRPRMQLGITEFDDTFRVVTTKDEDFARGILSGSMTSFLLMDPRSRKSPLQLRDNELFTWYTGTLSRQDLEEKLNYLCDVRDQIPAQVWTGA
ncbi:hypothetical protein [Streptomyces sp. NBC_00076]|uniref:hypothetical protein n=1 Tax=Streptomyces sp. NBC_00076 TaxID=2975642 RepID=UPI00325191C2